VIAYLQAPDRVWAAGKYVPLLYSRAAVDQAARTMIRLEPGRRNTL